MVYAIYQQSLTLSVDFVFAESCNISKGASQVVVRAPVQCSAVTPSIPHACKVKSQVQNANEMPWCSVQGLGA